MSDEIVNSVATAEETQPTEPASDASEATPAEEATGALTTSSETDAAAPEIEETPVASEAVVETPKQAQAPASTAAPIVDVIHFEGHEDRPRGRRKVRQGKVVSNKMQQTVVVAVESRVRHPLYGKFMRRTTRFKAHDAQNACGEGDTVEIMETRPLSKEKNWRVVRIIEKAK